MWVPLKSVHVAVVGAGIIGAALAGALARRGADVTVLDAAEPESGTSGSSLAWLNSNQKLPRHYHDLSARGLAEWHDLAAALGDPSWYVPTGSLTWDQPGTLSERLERLRCWGYVAEDLTTGQRPSWNRDYGSRARRRRPSFRRRASCTEMRPLPMTALPDPVTWVAPGRGVGQRNFRLASGSPNW